MNLKGLIEAPVYDNISKYLESGARTEVTEEIREFTRGITGEDDEDIVKKLMVVMYRFCIHKGDTTKDERKFRRSATEILKSREITGCCDCSTVFTALARSKGIPAMQILTFKKVWGQKTYDKKPTNGIQGHFFTACYLRDKSGNGDWFYIDTASMAKKIDDVNVISIDQDSRHFERIKKDGNNSQYYAFAFTRDYNDLSIGEYKIDSIHNMGIFQRFGCVKSDVNDWYVESELEK